MTTKFGISLPQASADFAAYLLKNPLAASYDVRQKRYNALPSFRTIYAKPDFASGAIAFLNQRSRASIIEKAARIDLPERAMRPSVIQTLVRAVVSDEAVEIVYHSVHSSTARMRLVFPHAFAHDGYRWHVRAFCMDNRDYRDFVVGRIESCRLSQGRAKPAIFDRDWNTWTILRLRPHRGLTKQQRIAIIRDFGMTRGQCTLRVRKALLGYTLAYLNVTPPAKLVELAR